MKRIKACLLLSGFLLSPLPAALHGPLVHWNRNPLESCRILWLEQAGAQGVEDRWALGPAGFGYGDGDDSTVFNGMQGRFTSIAVRCFVKPPSQTAGKTELVLKINYDDGFVAWIGGKEVARRNVVETKDGFTAAGPHDAGEWLEIRLGEISRFMGPEGTEMAVQGFNRNADSSDFTLHPTLYAKSGGREIPLLPQGQAWEYLAKARPEPGWQNRVLGLDKRDGETPAAPQTLRFRTRGESAWKSAAVSSRAFGETMHRVFHSELAKLPPASEIEFQIASLPGETFRFRTPPQAPGSIRFVTGGDVYHDRGRMDRMNRQAGTEDPLFALIGGDLAYANDVSPDRWFDYVDSWAALARAPDGRLIPKIVAIGNHETLGAGYHPNDAPGPEAARLFFSLFDFPEGPNATHAVDFGGTISFLMLDSGHTRNIADQKDWLAKALEARKAVPHLFVAYHRPAWGCGTKEDSVEIRRDWCPLFEKHRVTAVFEYDHHVFSRSHPVRGGRVDHENGIPYLGAGAWSVGTRSIDKSELARRPWIAASASANHYYLIETRDKGFNSVVKGIDGEVIDRFERDWNR